MEAVRDTLNFMSGLERMNSWFYRRVRRYLGKRILEAGCGNGNLTNYLLDRQLVVGLDNDADMLNEFRKRFTGHVNIKAVQSDLADESVAGLAEYDIDTVVCINTLEHLKDESLALNNFSRILRHGGFLIILVPAFQWLFSPLDKAAGHYRRYSLKGISALARESGFRIIEKSYFNFFGIFGWVLNGKVLRRERLSLKLLGLFDSLTPVLDFLERLIGPPVGLSIILVCEKEVK